MESLKPDGIGHFPNLGFLSIHLVGKGGGERWGRSPSSRWKACVEECGARSMGWMVGISLEWGKGNRGGQTEIQYYPLDHIGRRGKEEGKVGNDPKLDTSSK